MACCSIGESACWSLRVGWDDLFCIICDPLRENPALCADDCTVSQGACTVSCWIMKPGSATIATMEWLHVMSQGAWLPLILMLQS